MAPRNRTVRAMLEEAQTAFQALRNDQRIPSAARRAVRDAIGQAADALGQLDVDHRVDPALREQVYTVLRTAALELYAIEGSVDLPPTTLYAAIDKFDDAALCIRRGLTNRTADMGD